MPQPLRRNYELRITLRGVSPPIWRQLLIPDTALLSQLHDSIQAVMGWTDSHLHQFVVENVRYGVPDADDREIKDERQVRLRQLFKVEGDSALYEYDFGDSWEHDVRLIRILPFVARLKVPRCVEGKRACPPEDVGGPLGYRHFLRALKDKKHPEHKTYAQWIGGKFNPNAFDQAVANRKLDAQQRVPADVPRAARAGRR